MDSIGNPGIGTDGASSVDEESVDVTTVVDSSVLLMKTSDVVVVGDCVVSVAVVRNVAVWVDILVLGGSVDV
jgi:hypothetical protein